MTGTPSTADGLSFPRQSARTQRFTLGAPRSFRVSADGRRVWFLRSAGPRDATTSLWVHDADGGGEGVVIDPRALEADAVELTAEERARRERAREGAAGVTSYALDAAGRRAVAALGGRLVVADAALGSTARELTTAPGAFDPRLSLDGRLVAYCAGGALRVVDVEAGDDHELVAEAGVAWGLAEFVAAEEMGRFRGHWWAPDGSALLVARVDESPVATWWVGDPAHPEREPVAQRYPAAGTANADVSLWVVALDGARREVVWDRVGFEYLAGVHWSSAGPPLLLVQSRDQRRLQWREVDVASGRTTLLHEATDPHWLELVDGTPARLASGSWLAVLPHGDANALHVDGRPVTPEGLQVEAVLDVDGDAVLLAATDEPTERHLWRWSSAGLERLSDGAGVHRGALGGGTLVRASATLGSALATATVQWADGRTTEVASLAEPPVLRAGPHLLRAGERDLRTALLLPTGWERGSGRLPVLLDPYGGPHAARVLAAESAFLTSQWFADQGFAVVVVDGRGTPARGPAWERAITGRWGDAVLDDQLDALHAAAHECPDLDLGRVGIRGWSYGGYLAALAVLRRPDVVHAAVAGAPVTDWTLYDTHYTERYLGTDPHGADHARYAAESLLIDAPALRRPLLLIHGLADDNVVAAHTLRLSSALLAAGRPHEVLPLSGVTHMTSQEEVAENLLLLQVDFLRRHLGGPVTGAA